MSPSDETILVRIGATAQQIADKAQVAFYADDGSWQRAHGITTIRTCQVRLAELLAELDAVLTAETQKVAA